MTRGRILALACAALLVPMFATAAYAQGDPAAGRRVFIRCVACHVLNATGNHTVGPNLYKVVGREAGTVVGYDFKSKLKGSGIVWTEEELSKFLADPRPLVEGTPMQTFTGIPSEADRANLIAYLKQQGEQ